MVDLGIADSSIARGVNASGQVVGYIQTGGTSTAFSWTPAGGIVDLGTLGGNIGHAFGVNDNGLIVGSSTPPNGAREEARATLWQLGPTSVTSASATAPAGGTVQTNAQTSAADPIGTAVTTPTGGLVTIAEAATTATAPTGYSFVGQQVTITAPVASVAAPLRLSFVLDTSLAGVGDAITIFRDGVAVSGCTGTPGTASPDPCVVTQVAGGDGHSQVITVLSSHASRWNFGRHTPFNWTGFLTPVLAPPKLNPAVAGLPYPVSFRLGGAQGLNVVAVGSPSSRQVNCAIQADLGPLQRNASVGPAITYVSALKIYLHTWKTERAWAGTCRRLDLLLTDGTHHQAGFKFK